MIPAVMSVINISRAGGPEVLVRSERPVPPPGSGQVLIKVAYAGINRADCLQRTRGYEPKDATDVPGLEVAGEIVAVGAGVTKWKAGDRACALVNGGGYAQYCIAEDAITLPVPTAFDLKQAGAVPEAVFTAWFNIFMLGRLAAGEWLFIQGGSSGVGTTAIQLGKLKGAKVLTTAGSAEKCTACLQLGALAAINYREQDFVAEVKRASGGHGADVILDMAGAAYAARNVDALAVDGRLVHIKSGRGEPIEVPLSAITDKRAVITGSSLRRSTLQNKTRIAAQLKEHVWPHLGTAVMPVIDSVFPLEQAAQAHTRMESSKHIGKIVLQITH